MYITIIYIYIYIYIYYEICVFHLIINRLIDNNNNNNNMFLAFLDASKSVDKSNHNILFQRLKIIIFLYK